MIRKILEIIQDKSSIEEKRKILKEMLKEAIGNLPDERWKKVFKLMLEGYKIREIVEITGIPEGTIKTYIQRGKKHLRRILDRSIF